MLRRHLLALGAVASFGTQITGLGELLAELTSPEPAPLPSRLHPVHVAQVKDVRRSLADAGMTFGSDPEMSSAAAARAERLLTVPGTELLIQAVTAAVAHLHLHAGRAAFDGGLYEWAMYHYGRALDLATVAGDPFLQVGALNWAGLANVEAGHPNDGLKMLQFGQITARNVPEGDRRAIVAACGLADTATALAALGDPHAASRAMATARDLWRPTRTDRYGDLDLAAAHLETGRGRLDIAEPLAAASVRRWDGVSERARTDAGITLATIHVKAGEPRGLQLAHTAITDVTKLTSVRARRRLAPLAVALEARPGTDAKELARMARQIAA